MSSSPPVPEKATTPSNDELALERNRLANEQADTYHAQAPRGVKSRSERPTAWATPIALAASYFFQVTRNRGERKTSAVRRF